MGSLLLLAVMAGALSAGERVIAVAPVGDVPPDAVSLLLPTLRDTFGAEVVTSTEPFDSPER